MSVQTNFRAAVLLAAIAMTGSAVAQWTGTNPVSLPAGTSAGIGTSAPEAPLHVLAPTTATQLKVAPTTGGSNISLFAAGGRTGSIMFDADFASTNFRINSTEAVWLQKAGTHFRILGSTTAAPPAAPAFYNFLFDSDIGSGNTAIGGSVGSVPNPARFDVIGTSLVSGSSRRLARLVDNTTMAQGVGGGLDFVGKYDTTGTYTSFVNVRGAKTNATSGDFAGKFTVSVNDSAGTLSDVASIDHGGVAVTGNITATGSITGGTVIGAVYQDVAEWVPATTHMEPGTVVVLNRERRNEVMPSARPYDTAVAGVVSRNPGVILGVGSDSKAQVATTGRVKVRVDATAGAIAIGDLLVTSGKAGTAMKSQPIDLGGVQIHRPGTVIGKALEPLPSGEGEILVLLSLQ